MEKTIVFLDYANINRASEDVGRKMDWNNLLNYLSQGRFLIDAHAYVPIDPRNEHRMDRTIEDLWLAGYMVHSKVGVVRPDGYICDFDVEMAIDAMRVAQVVKPDIFVLASGDGHCMAIVSELRKMGIRVEVASLRHSTATEMMLKSSGFIDLDDYISTLQAQEEGHIQGDDFGDDAEVGNDDNRHENFV